MFVAYEDRAPPPQEALHRLLGPIDLIHILAQPIKGLLVHEMTKNGDGKGKEDVRDGRSPVTCAGRSPRPAVGRKPRQPREDRCEVANLDRHTYIYALEEEICHVG